MVYTFIVKCIMIIAGDAQGGKTTTTGGRPSVGGRPDKSGNPGVGGWPDKTGGKSIKIGLPGKLILC